MQVRYLTLDILNFRVGQKQLHFAVNQDVEVIANIANIKDDLVSWQAFVLHKLYHFEQIIALDFQLFKACGLREELHQHFRFVSCSFAALLGNCLDYPSDVSGQVAAFSLVILLFLLEIAAYPSLQFDCLLLKARCVNAFVQVFECRTTRVAFLVQGCESPSCINSLHFRSL
jgi:hypothetical protein